MKKSMYKNKAFISYRHSPCDMEIAGLIQRQLERFRIPKETAEAHNITRIGRIFRDQTDLGAQSDLTEELRKELDDSEYLIVVCSEDAVRSRWIAEEIRYFLKGHSAAEIIPVLSEGEPVEVLGAMFGQIEGMPRELRACDCRGNKRRVIREEIPRIAAALIGCSYDELIGRYRRYRHRRAAAAIVGAAALLILIGAYYAVSRSQLQKIRNENMIRESRDLSRRSSASLQEHAQFDAIRYALEALPKEGEERPYAGEAELALQKAVNAYVPEGGEALTQTGEFSVEGLIDDWACLQTDNGTWLAVQYENDGQYNLSVWETESGRRTFDSAQKNAELSEAEEDGISGEDCGGSLLITPEAVLWSDGSRILAVSPSTGSVLWEETAEGAYLQTILDAKEGLAAVYVYALSGDRETEELQFRRLSDGKLLSSMTPEAAKINMDEDAEGYTEIPKGIFSADGKELILEEDSRYYSDDTAGSCALYRIDTDTMEEKMLTAEPGIWDFCLSKDSGSLILLCETGGADVFDLSENDSGQIYLKAIRPDTGKEEWKAEDIDTVADYMSLLPAELPESKASGQKGGSGVILAAGVHAFLYDADTGEEVRSVTVPSPAEAAFLTGSADYAAGPGLQMLSQDGSCYTWNYEDGEVILQPSVLPEGVFGASFAMDSFFLYCPDESGDDFNERISVYRKGVGDRALCRIDLSEAGDDEEEETLQVRGKGGDGFSGDDSLQEESDEEYIIGTAENGTTFVVLTQEGRIFGIDAAAGEKSWVYEPEAEYMLTGVSQSRGEVVLHMDPDPDSDTESAIWTVLDMETGKARIIADPAAKIGDLSGADMEYIEATVAGGYMEFAVSPRTFDADTDNRIYIVRYSLADGSVQSEEVTGMIGDGPDDLIILYGNESGKNTLCFSSSFDEASEDRFLCIDWETGDVREQTLGEDGMLIHSSCAKWDEEGEKLVFIDSESSIQMIGTDGSAASGEDLRAETARIAADDAEAETEKGRGRIAGFDYYDGRLVTVESEKNCLWFRIIGSEINVELPVGKEDVVAEFPGGYMGETRVAVAEAEENKLLLQFGNDTFVINLLTQEVEMAAADVLEYNPDADVLLIGGGREVFLAKRYSCDDLVRMGNDILQNTESE